MRSYWIKVGLKSNKRFLIRVGPEKGTGDTEGKRSCKDRGREWSYAVQKILGATRSRKEQEEFFPRAFRGIVVPLTA